MPNLNGDSSLSKSKMLQNIGTNLPHAGHTLREGHQTSHAHLDRIAAVRRDDNAAFQKVAGFLNVITSGELRFIGAPRRPGAHTQFVLPSFICALFDLDRCCP